MFKALIVVFALIAAAFAVPAENIEKRATVYSTYGAYPYTYSAVPAVSAYSAYPYAYSGYPYGGYLGGYPAVRYVA